MIHKKQAFNILEDICKLNNNVWGNPKGSYNDAKESAYQIEEALEGLNTPEYIMSLLDGTAEEFLTVKNESPKELSNSIVEAAYSADMSGAPMDDVDRFDKHLDSIYFNIGSLHKLGLSPAQIVEGLQVVHNANLQKSGLKDSNGKVGKPTDFIGPEPELQKILDKRS